MSPSSAVRKKMLSELSRETVWDIIVIGGGATGLGAAVDAASRGLRTLLLEQSDFAKGTSSRSTKLIHGGLRYLQQGNISLVAEALKERGLLCKNAPHLVHHLPFVVPNYRWWEGPFYGIGLKIYDLLAGKLGIEPSRRLSLEQTLKMIPTLEPRELRGSVVYYDGQFDDARLALTLARTFFSLGGVGLNYTPVIDLIKHRGLLLGVVAKDSLTGKTYEIKARSVINATGAFCDALRKIDAPRTPLIIAPSQGIHLVLPKSFMPTDSALLVPHTEDGRVLFFVPWRNCVLLGTTDTPVRKCELEPRPLDKEIEFLLKYAAQYLVKAPDRSDVLSMFAGLRPLVKGDSKKNTAAISRDHTILISPSGLITIAGGKWTTYRKMAEDTINKAILVGGLPERKCVTENLKLYAYDRKADPTDIWGPYGSDRKEIEKLFQESTSYRQNIHPNLPYLNAHVIWAVRHEMAETIEDVLSRRTRSLLLDARASIEAAPHIAKLMAGELNRSKAWQEQQVKEFQSLAKQYLPS